MLCENSAKMFALQSVKGLLESIDNHAITGFAGILLVMSIFIFRLRQ